MLRRHPASWFWLLLSLSGAWLCGAEIGPFTGPEADAEAARLYERARDYIVNVTEGQYSYAYIQFYWRRSGANLERILTEYPSSPTAQQIRSGRLQAGGFPVLYFKERVLPRLEEKKVSSFDAVNCAIFLYELKSNRDAVAKQALLGAIIETLCRQQRWNEALAYPVPPGREGWLRDEVVRQAVAFPNDKLVAALLAAAVRADRPNLIRIIAAGLAYRGETGAALEKFLKDNGNSSELRAAVFSGLVRREKAIRRAQLSLHPPRVVYQGIDRIAQPEQRADLTAFLETIPSGPEHDQAALAYAELLASVGQLDAARQLAAGQQADGIAAAYASYLITKEEFGRAGTLPAEFDLSPDSTRRFTADLIEQLSDAGRTAEAASLLSRQPAESQDELNYRRIRGELLSTEKQFVVREKSFSSLPLHDPNLLGRLICLWSLTPNRTLRGAAPWDAVVYQFAPGFENLPAPKDKRKVEAAGR